MVAGKDIAFIARIGGEKMAMSFIGPCNGQIAAPWQQFKIKKRGSEVGKIQIDLKKKKS